MVSMKLLSFVIAYSCIAFASAANDIEDGTAPVTSPSVTTPAPSVDVPTNNYNYSSNGTVCLKANFGAQFIYEKEFWNVSSSASVDDDKSDCNTLTVNFDRGYFTIGFDLIKQQQYYISTVVVELKDPSLNATAHNVTKVKVTKGSSYLCKAGLTIPMSNNVTFKMTDVQLQPFIDDGKFGVAQNCVSDLSPIVPIIVGAVLAGLVVVVIVAYFVGRSRNRVGYEEI